jgi:hypothetical protein
MQVAEERMNDYKRIRINHHARRLRASDTLAAHHESVEFLRAHCAKEPHRRRVIVSHHRVDASVPTRLGDDPVAAAYSSRKLDLVAELAPLAWLSGHVHESYDYTFCGSRMSSSPKGHGPFSAREPATAWQNRRFDPRFTLTV